MSPTRHPAAEPPDGQPRTPVSHITPTLAALAEAPTIAGAPNPPPAPDADPPVAPIIPSAAGPVLRRVGRYTLRRLIGEGGMGAVYEAEQDNPRRIVALKVMRSAIASESAARRFEYEAHLLARLRHPGIAQIFEAGTHTLPPPLPGAGAQAIPYYAMEYIPGARTLTDYARAAGLSVRQRLELFVKVCEAVHHGHTKGVIHRDLKPANILVDSSGEPKVIDFGVARAADADPASPTLHTQPGMMVGTPQYMSPEQVAGETDIDTRSDVYALGVVLYEALAGELPYDLSGSGSHELTRIIREQPARRLSLATRSEVRGDAETIVHKALEKDRERRYQSAADLASDIRRYLNNEPISARPPSVGYQLRVMARRHKGVVGGIAVGAAALLAGAGVSTTFAFREAAQRKQAVVARDEARGQADRARRVTEFLGEMLATADPHTGHARDMTVRELVDVAARRVGEVFKDDPIADGQIRLTLGKTYYHLGDPSLAREQLEAAHRSWSGALGENDPDTLNALALLGVAVMGQGKPAEAEALLREALERQSKVIGEDHKDTLATLSNLALTVQDQGRFDEAERLLRRALDGKLRTLGPADDETLASQMNLSDLLQSQGRVDEAITVARESATACEQARGPRHLATLTAQSILASALHDAGRDREAAPLLKQVYDTRVEVLGENHPDTLTTLNTMALGQEAMGRYDDAEPMLRKALAGVRATLGPEHPTTLIYANNLANCLRTRADAAKPDDPRRPGDLDEAERLFREVLPVREKLSGPVSIDTLSLVNNLALLLEMRGRSAEAEPMLRRVVDGLDQALPHDHYLRYAARKNLAECLIELGRDGEAEPMLKTSYDELVRILGKSSPRTTACAKTLAKLYEKRGQAEQAATWKAASEAKDEPPK